MFVKDPLLHRYLTSIFEMTQCTVQDTVPSVQCSLCLIDSSNWARRLETLLSRSTKIIEVADHHLLLSAIDQDY